MWNVKLTVRWAFVNGHGAKPHGFLASSATPGAATISPSAGTANVCDASLGSTLSAGLPSMETRSPTIPCGRARYGFRSPLAPSKLNHVTWTVAFAGRSQTVSRFQPSFVLMRYETQSGFGLSLGPIAATVWISRSTTGWPLTFVTGTEYAGEPARVVRCET